MEAQTVAVYQYPECSSYTPCGHEVQCGNEDCWLHNILWLESVGFTHEESIGLAAVYRWSANYSNRVADALGGLDEFENITMEDPESPQLKAWYHAHLPLVQYLLEGQYRDMLRYWYQAQTPSMPVPKSDKLTMLVQRQPDGTWVPYTLPGYPTIFQDNNSLDPLYAVGVQIGQIPGFYETHAWVHFSATLS
jgi:hypothetical protein